MEDIKSVNIFLDSEKQSVNRQKINNILDENTSPYAKYIISMNDDLVLDNKNLREEIKKLEHEKELLTDDNDRFDESKRYTIGLLKNLSAIKNYHMDLNKLYEKHNSLMDNFSEQLYKYITYYRYVTILNMIFCLFIFYNVILTLLLNFVMVIVVLKYCRFLNSEHEKISFESKLLIESIKALKLDIDKITKENDFLDNLIENI